MLSATDESHLRHIQAHHSLPQQQQQQQVKSSAAAGRAAAAAAAAAGSPGKKLIGIRYLFPAFDERATLLERARVWVARHDCKYFVDWSDAQLQTVDPALRPLAPITRDLYKLHMNRSDSLVTMLTCMYSDDLRHLPAGPWYVRARRRRQRPVLGPQQFLKVLITWRFRVVL